MDVATPVPFLDRAIRQLPFTQRPEPTNIMSPLRETNERHRLAALTMIRFAPLLRKRYGAGWRQLPDDGDQACHQIYLRIYLNSFGGFLEEIRVGGFGNIDPLLHVIRRDLIELATDFEQFCHRYRRQIVTLEKAR